MFSDVSGNEIVGHVGPEIVAFESEDKTFIDGFRGGEMVTQRGSGYRTRSPADGSGLPQAETTPELLDRIPDVGVAIDNHCLSAAKINERATCDVHVQLQSL